MTASHQQLIPILITNHQQIGLIQIKTHNMENLSTPQPQTNKPVDNTATNLVLPSVGQQLTYPLDYTTQEILIDFIKRLPVYPVQYTTAQRDTLRASAGMVIYNITTNKLNFYNGTAWEVVTSV